MLLSFGAVTLEAEVPDSSSGEYGVLSSVYVPLVGGGNERSLSIEKVPAILFGGRPNAFVDAMLCPVYPATPNSNSRKTDLNALTRSGIKFGFEPRGKSDVYIFGIDLKGFKPDPALPNVEDILHALLACIRIQHPVGIIGAADDKLVGTDDVLLKRQFEGHLWLGGRKLE